MRPAQRRWSLGALLLAGAAGWASDPLVPPIETGVVTAQVPRPGEPEKPKQPEKPGKPKGKEPEKPPLGEERPAPPTTPRPDPFAEAQARAATQTNVPTAERSRAPTTLGDPGPDSNFPPGQAPGRQPLPEPPNPPTPPAPRVPRPGLTPVPSVRADKVGKHESVAPLDRAYVAFNYYDNVNAAVNRRFGSDVRDLRLYRETFGLEKTFLDGQFSLGLRLPLNTLSGRSDVPALDGTSTAFGDLTILFKYALWDDPVSDNVLSLGLAVTVPTGPDALAGSPLIGVFHNTTLQPFVGYLATWGDFFVQGFASVGIPTDSDDVTMLYNDVAFGYYLFRSDDPDRWLRSLAPTFEVHVNTPLNHRGIGDGRDPAGTPDVVNLTYGVHARLGRWANLAVGVATPVTGPRPFDFEVIARLETRF